MTPTSSRTQGFVLITALVVSALLLTMLMAVTIAVMSARRTTASEAIKTQAFYAAQSGMERAWAKGNLQKNIEVPAGITTSAQGAAWLATQLNLTGALGRGGSYVVTATSSAPTTTTLIPNPDATLTLTSAGRGPNAGRRRITLSFPVRVIKQDSDPGPMIGTAPAALSITGNSSIGGSAPITGDIGAVIATHTMNCPVAFAGGATCTKSKLSPPQYTLKYKGAIPAVLTRGAHLRPTQVTTGQTSEERYIVDKIDPATGEVTLNVLSDFIANNNGTNSRRTFSATSDITFQQRTDVPALLIPPDANFSNVSNNVRNVCITYTCERYTMNSSDLFKSIMGGDQTTIETQFKNINNSVPGTYRTGGNAPCSNTISWLKVTSNTVSVSECPTPQMLIVDARTMRGSINIDIGSQQSFHGLLYILGNNDTPVKATSNLGFAGGVIIDNGTAGFDMAGTGNFNTECLTADSPTVGNKTAKLCYDKAMLSKVRTDYIDLILSKRILDFTITSQTWKEVAQ